MCRIEKMFIATEEEASLSKSSFRLGAVISSNGKIVGRGHNSNKSHTQIGTNKYSKPYTRMHAEIAAMINAYPDHIAGGDMYVVRLKRDGTKALSKPCNLCMWVMKKHGVNKVFYTIKDDEYGVIKLA